MEQKYRLDLSAPPPPPKPKGAPEPQKHKEPEKRPEERRQKPKKRGGVALGILLGVAVAAVLFCGYRFVHFWSEPTCTQKARCSICGLEQGDYAAHSWKRGGDCDEPSVCAVCGQTQDTPAGHDWTGGSCTMPRFCSVCRVYENQAAPGHSFAEGVCTVCGAKQNKEVLKWKLGDYAQVGYGYRSETGALSISTTSWAELTRMTLDIQDWEGNAVSTDRYTVERSAEEVVLNLPDDLAPGRYTIYAGVQQTKVLEFWFGTADAWMPAEPDKWFADFETKNWKQGLFLAAFDEKAPLRGVQTEEEATRFGSPWQMSAAAIDYEDGQRTLIQGGPGSGKSKFRADTYCCIRADGMEDTAVVFSYEDWYLAMDSEGAVFLSETLTDECYWIITSSI